MELVNLVSPEKVELVDLTKSPAKVLSLIDELDIRTTKTNLVDKDIEDRHYCWCKKVQNANLKCLAKKRIHRINKYVYSMRCKSKKEERCGYYLRPINDK